MERNEISALIGALNEISAANDHVELDRAVHNIVLRYQIKTAAYLATGIYPNAASPFLAVIPASTDPPAVGQTVNGRRDRRRTNDIW